MATILLIPHMAAGDRDTWSGDPDLRPLSDLGRRQAEALAEALEKRDLAALYASPALRAQQTLEPIAAATGLSVEVVPRLAEKQPGETTAEMVQRAWESIQQIAEAVGGGTAAAASHGDLIPALAQYLANEYQLAMVPDITRRGQWFEIEIEGTEVWVTLSEAPSGFPGS